MALPDIKDVGILAGFVRWGWPYHGLATTSGGSTTIVPSGKVIPDPYTGNAWLIDKGLAALDMTPAEITAEAAEGREWLNYGMISGGVLYGTALPAYGLVPNSWIFVDSDGLNWLIELASWTFPSTNVVRLTLSIVRFGLFDLALGPQTPITKTVDVSCEAIELTNPAGGPFYGRGVELHDVWTNGSKALLCVWMGLTASNDQVSMFSAIEVTFSGSGGADGSTLSLAAVEVMGQSALTTNGSYDGTNSSGNYDPIQSGDFTGGIVYDPSAPVSWGYSDVNIQDAWVGTAEIVWNQNTGFDAGLPVLCGYVYSRSVCRLCQYDASGNVSALRLKMLKTVDHWLVSTTSGTIHGSPNTSPADSMYGTGVLCNAYVDASITIAGAETIGYYLMRNAAVVDKIEHVINYSGVQQFYYGADPTDPSYPTSTETPMCSTDRHTHTTYGASSQQWNGSVTGSLSTAISLIFMTVGTDPLAVFALAARVAYATSLLSDGTTQFGTYRTDNVAAFCLPSGGNRNYGTVTTQVGNQTTTETGDFYFAWQRKTGAVAFSANPICYV